MKLDKAVKINELTTALEYADKTNMDLRAENERLQALKESIEVQEHLLHGRIEAALAIYENDPYDPKLERAAAMAQALKGEA